jgi:ArsR family transcriptional regulator, arsenate/arsenite/antimonite-responsive transcriptional repressor
LTFLTPVSYFSDMKVIDQTEAEARTVAMLRAIAHPARFRIVRLLAERQTCVCGDLVDELPLAQSTVSEHLKVLKDAGIVQGTIEGPNTCYCLEPSALEWLRDEFSELSKACC